MIFDARLNKLIGRNQFATHNRIEVSADALRHNIELMHSITQQQVIPVLKANAYGHGIAQVAQALNHMTPPIMYVAVDGYHEALQVRKVSRLPVLIMGKIKPANFKSMRLDDFAFVVSDAQTIQALAAVGRRIAVHLELNTGMNRYGATQAEALELAKQIKQSPSLELAGVMSHLADSDGSDQATIDEAVDRFDAWVASIEALVGTIPHRHIAQTAGSVRAHSRTANAIRLGIGLYGINPFAKDHPARMLLQGLQPALRFVSTITAVHGLQPGEGVGYNYQFRATRPTRMAVLPVGYYEGLPYQLGNRGVLRGSNHDLPIAGKVCMNHCMIDITQTDLKVGDEVIVISDNLDCRNTVQAFGDDNQLFPYAILVQLSSATRRLLV